MNVLRKRAIGFNAGLRGDLIMNTVVARAFKQVAPDWHLTLGVGPQFADMEPLFFKHPHIDAFHAYHTYDNWPSQQDKDYLHALGYDTIFNPMPQHTHSRWHDYVHQCEEACWMNGLRAPLDGIQCHLTKWFDVPDYQNYVALNYVGAFYAGYPNNKSYSPERAEQVVNFIRKKGYKVIVLGDPREPYLENTESKKLSYFESVRVMLGCKMFLGIDSGLNWVSSAYSHPTLACYSNSYYGKDFVKNIQPVNPNARYFDADNLNHISLDLIEQELENLLK